MSILNKILFINMFLYSSSIYSMPSITWDYIDCGDVKRGADVAYNWKKKGLYENYAETEVRKERWISSDELKLIMYYTYDRDYDDYRSKNQCEEDKEESKKKKDNDIFNNPAMLEHMSKSSPKMKELIEKRKAMEPQMREIRRLEYKEHMKEQREKIDYFCKQLENKELTGVCNN